MPALRAKRDYTERRDLRQTLTSLFLFYDLESIVLVYRTPLAFETGALIFVLSQGEAGTRTV